MKTELSDPHFTETNGFSRAETFVHAWPLKGGYVITTKTMPYLFKNCFGSEFQGIKL